MALGRMNLDGMVGLRQPMESSTAFHQATSRSFPLIHWENMRLQQRKIWRNIHKNLDSSFKSITLLIQPQTEHILIVQLPSLVNKRYLK